MTGSVLPGGDILRGFARAAASGVLVVDDAGTVLLSNASAQRLVDRTEGELAGGDLGIPLVPNGITEIDVAMRDGSTRAVEMQVMETTWEQQTAYFVALKAVSEHKLAARELDASEERFRAIFEESPIGLAILGTDFHFLRVNRALCAMLGYTPDELMTLCVAEVGEPDAHVVEARRPQELVSGKPVGEEFEAWWITKAGVRRRVQVTSVTMRGRRDEEPKVIVTVRDVTQRSEEFARVAFLALHDELTGLANRVLAMDRLRIAQARAERHGAFVALLFLDLDGFKAVNDSLGHAAGDALLADVGERLQSVLRPSDTAARLGGDEFLICCEDLGSDATLARAAALRVVERVSSVLGRPEDAGQVTASIGIALVRGTEVSPDRTLRHADQAMYRAKALGKGRFAFFDQALEARTMRRLNVRDELTLAVERDELVLHYQPIASLEDGRIIGAEALVRWDHPVRGLLLPRDFLEIAEESGLIVPIGQWVVHRACEDLASWRPTVGQGLVVTVNASARQLRHELMATSIGEALRVSGLEPGALEIELTETALIDAAGPTLVQLEGVRDLGVRVGLDDFGTGYASLSYLRRLPVDSVKIDRSFVAGLGENPDDEAIVKAVVDLGHALGLLVVTEGVESLAQRRSLEAIGCDCAQGWHFGHPQPADAFAGMLQAAAG